MISYFCSFFFFCCLRISGGLFPVLFLLHCMRALQVTQRYWLFSLLAYLCLFSSVHSSFFSSFLFFLFLHILFPLVSMMDFSFPLCVHYGASVLPFFPPSVVLLLFFGRRRVPQKLLFCFVLIGSHFSSSGESKLYDATGHCENIEFFTYYYMHSRRQIDGWRPLTFFPLLH